MPADRKHHMNTTSQMRKGEVVEAGDQHGRMTVEQRNVFANAAEPNGSLDLRKRDSTSHGSSVPFPQSGRAVPRPEIVFKDIWVTPTAPSTA
jgi:hypothetical protein